MSTFPSSVDLKSFFDNAGGDKSGSRSGGSPFDSAVSFTLGEEGGYVANDAGKGETNFGINKTANPDVNVKDLSEGGARSLYKTRYWDAIGGDDIAKKNQTLATIAFDTAVNMGVTPAQNMLRASGGDPSKFLQLRAQKYDQLLQANPQKYGQYAEGWSSRLDKLRELVPQATSPTEPAKYYEPRQAGKYVDITERKGATAMDVAKEFFASATEGVGSIGQFAGEGAAAVANAATGTQDYEGKNVLKPVSEAIRGTMTEGGKQARESSNIEGSVLDLFKGDAKLPDNVDGWLMMGANGFGSLLTSVIPIAGPAGRVASLTKAARAAELAGDVAKAAELTKAAEAAARSSRVIGAGSGAAMTGGAAADDVRDSAAKSVSAMSHEQLLANVPVYSEVFAQTGDERQARGAVVNSAARWAAGLSSIAGAAGGAFNAKVIEDFLAKKGMSTMLGDSMASRTGRATVGGAAGTFAEGGQETSEKVGQNVGENIGLGRDPGQDAFRNTAGDFVGGAMVGGPIGAGGGFISKPSQPVVPPHLQPVVDQAQKPGSVLSRAAVAGNAGTLNQATNAGGANTPAGAQAEVNQTQSETVDPISQRVQSVVQTLESTDTLQKLRDLAPQMGAENLTSDFLYALQVARNPNSRPDQREAAINQVEQAIEWTKTGFTTPQEKPQQPGTAVALRENNAVGPVGQAQFFDPNTIDGEAVRVDNMIGGPKALTGPQSGLTTTGPQAAAETGVAEPAAPRQPVHGRAPIDTSAEQQNVGAQTIDVSSMAEVKAPRVETPAGSGPAFLRKRAAVVKQLAENGFETVQRDGKDFYMVNAKTGQKFKLDGPADAQLARKAINDHIDAIAHTAAASPLNNLKAPTKAQIEAGNYKKSDVIELNGMQIKIENPKGSVRSGVSPDGEVWETKMAHHYGEFQGTVGADGDKLDVFIGPRKDSDKVYVIDQVNEDGSFDEHKVMMGFTTEEAARQGYLANYSKGWTGLGAIKEMSVEEFKTWAKSRETKKPASDIAAMQKALGPANPIPSELNNARIFTRSPADVALEAEDKEQGPIGQFATYEEAKDYISQQKRANGNVSGLPLRLNDGSFTIASKNSPQYAEAKQQQDERNTTKQDETFTITDGGKPVKLRKVKKQQLPKDAASASRGRDGRQLTQDDVSLLQQVAGLFGKTIQVFSDESGKIGDGFVRPEDPSTVYVNENSGINPLAVFGHEFWHQVKDEMPEVHAAVMKVVQARAKTDEAYALYADKLGYAKADVMDELSSDLAGDLMMDPTFWSEVFAQIERDNGGDAKGIIAKLSAFLNSLITRLVGQIDQEGFGASALVNDAAEVRDAFRKGLASYMQASNISKSSMDAEIKKSVIRQSAEDKARQEYADVEAKYKGTDEWMKAPDGTDTKLTERQWVQVRTPSFKSWFGDWEKFAGMQGGVWNDDKGEVSKVVDANGEPLVVYHGTAVGGFSEFREPTGERRGDLGIFASPNLEMALTYRKGRAGEIQFENMDREKLVPGENVEGAPGYYASFMNIRNPLESDFEGAYWNGERPEQFEIFTEDGEQIYSPSGKAFFTEAELDVELARLDAENISAKAERAPDHFETTDSVVREARSSGSDGAIIRSVVDSGSGFSSYIDEPSDVFVAFKPEQIKSATQNTGEFSKKTGDLRFSRSRSDVDADGFNEFTATADDIAQAKAYEQENGILPYTSAGQLQVPVELEVRKSVKREGKYGNHPVLGIPLNANGTVSLYFPTTNEDARRVTRERTLKGAAGSNRVYLTNESSGGAVMAKPGNIDQGMDGANVLLQINPDYLQIDTEHEDGRKDFFVPIAEGEAFRQKMQMVKLFTQNAPRTKGLSKSTTIKDITENFTAAIDAYLAMPAKERRARLKQARENLRKQHNVGTLLGVNGKLEKTNVGGYGLNNYNGKDVMSMGLGLASAQKINDEQKLTTCPQSASCESLCLGETSGQNLLYGGEGQFRSGPRLSQYLKTEALVQSPADFAVVLFAEVDRFNKSAAKEDYQATVRLNVTSDFNPKVFEALINAQPDVMFYDYTKLNTSSIAPNHHLTYSSTGASQIVDGKVIFNENSNWNAMVTKLNKGLNVAMAFSNKNDMPKFVVDGKTGKRFQVWNGDNYDARFLDPKRKDGIGMIVGLTNKDRTGKPEEAAVKNNGFFIDYNPERDGDTVVIPDQEAIKAGAPQPLKFVRFSRAREETPEFKRWSNGAPVIALGEVHEFKSGQPVVVQALHGTTNADLTEFQRSRANIESDIGAGFYASNTPEDVATNYANNDGADLTKRVELLAERLEQDDEFDGDMDAARDEARKRLSQSAPNTMKLYMRFNNPAVIGGNETYLDYSEPYNEERDEYEEPSGQLVDFVEALRNIAPDFNVRSSEIESTIGKIFEQAEGDGIKIGDALNIIKRELLDASDDEGNLASAEVFRLALSQIGFDGIIDTTVFDKFGPQMRRNGQIYDRAGGMKGMTEDTVHFIAFEPEQIKSATGNSGEFGENRNILKSVKRPQFYSQLQRAIESVPDRLATMAAPAWRQWLTANAPKLGIKAEEVEWSGIKDYLDLQGKAKLSKDELSTYLDDGGVKVSEVTLGAPERTVDGLPVGYKIIDEGDGKWSFSSPSMASRLFNSRDSAVDAAKRDAEMELENGEMSVSQPKYNQYTLPGGENYRELLITLPEGQESLEQWRVLREGGVSDGMYTSESAAQKRADAIGGTIEKAPTLQLSTGYKSSHWNQLNILAHIRVNDRTDADGKRVLFVEEVQSDWGQDGKKKGFKPSDAQVKANAEKELELRKRVMELRKQGFETPDDGTPQSEIDPKFLEVQSLLAQQEELRKQDSFYRGLPPSAPFVTKTEGWLNLALKRIAMMAVEGGYDKVAFVNGEQSADRYDLSKQLSRVAYRDGRLQGYNNDGALVMNQAVEPEELPDYVGKELGAKMAENAQKDAEVRAALRQAIKDDLPEDQVDLLRDQLNAIPGEYSGLDLKVGGKGMIKFYDEIVPQALNKLLPKLGGGKMGTVNINAPDRRPMGRGAMMMLDEDKRLDQPGFDVTDKMRETVSAGVPLFSRKRDPQTQTDSFKKWFGNSKVVDGNGDPLVMYHGTTADFSEFRDNQRGVHFVSASKNWVSKFYTSEDGSIADGANVMPVYVSAQNPFDFQNKKHVDALARAASLGGAAIGQIKNGSWSRLEDRTTLEAIKRLGFDGLYVSEDGHKNLAVFSTTQIKSATGNDGGFDPTNPDIRKSRKRDTANAEARKPYFDDLAKLKVTTNYTLGDLLKTSKKLSWWDRTIGTQYNLAQKHPQFKRVFDAVQQFINDVSAYATRAADMAPNILPKLESFKDIVKSPLSAADVKALRDPIFGGTLTYARDEQGQIYEEDDVSKAGVVFTDEELRGMFNLSDKQISLYREFRSAVDQSLTDLAISDMLRYLGADAEAVKEEVMAAGNVDFAVAIISRHLTELGKATPERAAVMTNTIEAIEQKAEQANRLMDRGYAPLSRFGQYTVYVVGPNGEQEYFSMFENERDANVMATKMKEQYPDATVTTGTMSQESYKLFSGVTPETLALFGESLGLEESGIDPKSEAYQQMLKVAKTNRSAMKRLIQRKGIDGYSEDAGRVLAGFVYSNARQVATNLHAGEISKSVQSVTDGDVKDAAIRLMEYIQNPQEEAQALRGLMFTQFIGGSIASAMVNMTQPFTMTLPYLAQFAGATGSAKLMADAVKLASRGIRNDDELRVALKRAEDEGVVSPQEVHQLMAQAQGRGALQSGDGTKVGDAAAKLNNTMAKLGLGWGRLFSAAEQFNRRVTFIAAYKVAREQGIENPFQFAEKAIAETQGVYNKGNKPAWARGAVGGTLFTFKQYSIGYVEFLRRMWGNGPEGKKAVGLALGVLFLMSGMGGMPGADDLDDVIDGFAQRVLGRSFDSKQAKKEFFASILGQAGAEFVMSGVSGLPGMPIDVAGRMGLGNLIPGTGLLTKKRDYGQDYKEIVGPAGTLFTNAGLAIANIAEGEFGKAAQAVSPVAAQNWIKTADMVNMGFYRDQKGRKVVDTDGYDAFAKFLGFQPRAVAQVQEATSAQQGLIAQNKLRETEIADKWAAGRIEKNPAKVEEAKQMLANWNEKNPQSKISIDPSQINKRVIEANKTKAQRIAATAPKELRASVKKELESSLRD